MDSSNKISPKQQLNTEQMHKKVKRLSKQNRKLLQSLSSHLILQTSYVGKYLKPSFKSSSYLQCQYENLMKLSSESMTQNQTLRSQLQQKKMQYYNLKSQIQQLKKQSYRLDEEKSKSQRKELQQEFLQKHYQMELQKRNNQLRKQIYSLRQADQKTRSQNAKLQNQKAQLQNQLFTARQQLSQAQFLATKKQQEQKAELIQLDDLKKQLLKKRDKLRKATKQYREENQKNSKNHIIREIDDIQSLITDFKKNRKAS